LDALLKVFDDLCNEVRSIQTRQMSALLNLINPVFNRFGYDLIEKDQVPVFKIGYDGNYETLIRYKSRNSNMTIDFSYTEGLPLPIRLAIKPKGILNHKYEKPKTLKELETAVQNAILR
jgi:hypothetical protein